jgi:hypothetical protein
MLACGCGQQCTFTFSYSTSTDGHITIEPLGIGGGITGATAHTSELSATVGPSDYEYRGYKVVLRETKESGTYTTSYSGFFGAIKFILTLATNQFPLPTITYHRTTLEENDLLAAIKICRKRC